MPVLFFAATLTPTARGAIVVAYESGVDAYAEALEGITATLGSNSVRTVDVRGGDSSLARALGTGDAQLVIVVGSRALAEVQARKTGLPTIVTMTMRPSGERAGFVDLDIPLAMQLQAMRALWPDRLRAGIIRNPARSRSSAEGLESRARKEGYTAVVIDCDGPAPLLKAVAALKGKVDFLLCFPDADLFNPVTIKPLVLASLDGRLPIIGFSPAFVRAGAAVGIYPDYREIGRQTAEMARRLLKGEDRTLEEGPRKIQLGVNQRVARLLGVDFKPGTFPFEVFR